MCVSCIWARPRLGLGERPERVNVEACGGGYVARHGSIFIHSGTSRVGCRQVSVRESGDKGRWAGNFAQDGDE